MNKYLFESHLSRKKKKRDMNIQLKRYIYDNDECTRWQYLFEKRKLKVLEIYETKKKRGKNYS